MICANPSVDVELILSTPLMPEILSSSRVTTSRSTTSGEAPGYAIADEDDRCVDVRKLVRVEPRERREPEDDERDHRHDGDDRSLDRKVGYEHGAALRVSLSIRQFASNTSRLERRYASPPSRGGDDSRPDGCVGT